MAIDEKKLKPCPFCGSEIRVVCTDDEGNLHDEDYERNPWSGLGYVLYHDITDVADGNCPIAKHECEGMMGVWIYDTKEEAIEAWNNRTELSLETKTSDNDVIETNVGKWIPIKYDYQSGWLYNLPDDRQEVLVCWSENGRITLDTFVDEGEDGCWWENGDRVEVGQAWMPKPEAYKGDE